MFLELDFEHRATLAVLTEIANRSTSAPNDPKEIINAAPVTQYHFGGTCYYSKFYKRFAWVRTYLDEKGGVPQYDRLVVSFGHYDPPADWKTDEHTNQMKHSHVTEIVDAANQIVSFVLDGSLPETLYPGDYHYREPILKAFL